MYIYCTYLRGVMSLFVEDEFNNKLQQAMEVAGITRVGRLTQMDYILFPVFQAVRPLSKNYVTAQGKSFNAKQAKIASIMESLETFCAENVGIHQTCPLAEIQNQLTYDIKTVIKENLKEKIRWTKAYDLIQNRPTYLPHALVSLDFTDQYTPEFDIFMNSNGYAGGIDKEMALHHALLEVLERHIIATTTPHYVKLDAEIDAALQPYFRKLFERKFKIAIFYYPNEFNLPVFKINLKEVGMNYTYFGMACHPDKNTCLRSAFAEAIQSRVTAVAGARDDINYNFYKPTTPEESNKQILIEIIKYDQIENSNQDYLTANPRKQTEMLLNRIKKAGFNSIVYCDLTLQEIGIPFVFVFVPGFGFNLH